MNGERLQWPFRAMVFVAIAVVVMLSATIPGRIADGAYLNHVSGTWAALADDAARGVLYRPLLSADGYGGTRYFPLPFLAHGLLAQMGIPLLPAGHALSLAAGILLVFASALALSRRGATTVLAWSFGALTLASPIAFGALGSIRGDVLPLALGVLGVALAPRQLKDPIWPCAVVIALAMLAKPTLVWAPCGVAIAIGVRQSTWQAARLLAIAAVVWLAGFGACLWWSEGNMLTGFHATALGGGLSIETLVFNLRGAFHPSALLWIGGGLSVTLLRGRRGMLDAIGAALLICLPITLVVFASPGISINMLFDADALGALALGAALLDGEFRSRITPAVMGLAAMLGVVEAVAGRPDIVHRSELQLTAAALPTGVAPVLSEHPWIPLLAGERPFLLDPFSLRQTRIFSAAVDRDLLARLDAKGFRAVVLLGRPETSEDWYQHFQFGPGFTKHLLKSYRFDRVVGGFVLYLPRDNVSEETPGRASAPELDPTYLDRLFGPRPLRKLLDRLRGKNSGESKP